VNHIYALTAFVVHLRHSSLNNTQHIECIRGVSLATMRNINLQRHRHWHCLDLLPTYTTHCISCSGLPFSLVTPMCLWHFSSSALATGQCEK